MLLWFVFMRICLFCIIYWLFCSYFQWFPCGLFQIRDLNINRHQIVIKFKKNTKKNISQTVIKYLTMTWIKHIFSVYLRCCLVWNHWSNFKCKKESLKWMDTHFYSVYNSSFCLFYFICNYFYSFCTYVIHLAWGDHCILFIIPVISFKMSLWCSSFQILLKESFYAQNSGMNSCQSFVF